MRSFLLASLLTVLSPMLLSAEEIRRVALDGVTPVAAPAQVEGRIDKVEAPALELYPAPRPPAHGTILISPGGGYRHLAIEHEGRRVAALLNEAGWDAAVLLYHINEGEETRPRALADATAAYQLLRTPENATGLSTRRVGLIGFSAGGHLSARLAHESEAREEAPAFVVLMYPAYLETKEGGIQPEVTPAKIPSFLYVAADDKYAPSAYAFEAACRREGVRLASYFPEAGGHGFGIKEQLPAAVREWPATLKGFLARLPQP